MTDELESKLNELETEIEALPGEKKRAVIWVIENFDLAVEMCGNSSFSDEGNPAAQGKRRQKGRSSAEGASVPVPGAEEGRGTGALRRKRSRGCTERTGIRGGPGPAARQ